MKLGKVSRFIFFIVCQNFGDFFDFILRVQVKDDQEVILIQFCVQIFQFSFKSVIKSFGQRRFFKKNEVGKIILFSFAVIIKYSIFQDRFVFSFKFGKLFKIVVRQSKNYYLLEYKKGDVVVLFSEEKIRLKGQLWIKEWYIGYYQGKVGFVYVKNVLVVGRVRFSFFFGFELSISVLLEQILRFCKFLIYIYAFVRILFMENISSWRVFVDVLGYGSQSFIFFCRVELDSEFERVAFVLEKLKEDCNNTENKDRKFFQKEFMMVSVRGFWILGGWCFIRFFSFFRVYVVQ